LFLLGVTFLSVHFELTQRTNQEDEDEPPTPTPADSAAPPALPPPLTEALMTSTPLDGADAGADRAKGHRKSRSVSTIQVGDLPD